MSIVLALLARLAGSKIGLMIMVAGGLFVIHTIDKAAAVREAREGYVQSVELDEAEAKVAEMERRAVVAEKAAEGHQEKMEAAAVEARRFAAELEEYRNATAVNSDCVVDGHFIGRLRSQ